MKNTKDYSVITIGEFLEFNEKTCIDKIFSDIRKENRKMNFMVNKSILEYLKSENRKTSKYDILKAEVLI